MTIVERLCVFGCLFFLPIAIILLFGGLVCFISWTNPFPFLIDIFNDVFCSVSYRAWFLLSILIAATVK